jgi:uncharacterized protein with LGFP repeats
MSTISTLYTKLGGSGGELGPPITEELVQDDGRSHYQHYANGAIYTSWTPNPTSPDEPMSVEVAHEVHGAIFKKWKRLGLEKGVLGLPTTNQREAATGDHYNRFQNGSIYAYRSIASGRPDEPSFVELAYEVHGAIHEKWRQMGFENSPLHRPTTDERGTPDGVGRFNNFLPDGIIYWSAASNAHVIYGVIYKKFRELDGLSFLGYPIEDEWPDSDAPDGRHAHFQHGDIYYTPATGAHEVHGAIGERLRKLKTYGSYVPGYGSMGQHLGYPITDETGTPDGVGRYNHFERGSIYYTPETGAWEVFDIMRDKWASLGWERSFLGYPISEEGKIFLSGKIISEVENRASNFQGGIIIWSPATGIHEVHGAIYKAWSKDIDAFGLPVSDELPFGSDGARVSKFEKGAIYWTPWSGISINKEPPPKPGTKPPPPPATGSAPFYLYAKHKDSTEPIDVWTYEGSFPLPGFMGVAYITGLGALLTSPAAPYEVRFFKAGKGELDWKDESASVPMKNTETLGPDKIKQITGGDSAPKSIKLLAMSTIPASDSLGLVATFVKK